jgi:hypothetical protein
MEKLLTKFDFDFKEISKDSQISIQREIRYLQKKFKTLFSEEVFDKIINTLTGFDEYKDFIDHLQDFFIDLTRLQMILKTNPNPNTFGSLVLYDYIFSQNCFEMYNTLLFQNVTKLFLIFATMKPKRIDEIFIAFCKVFVDDKDFITHALVSLLLKNTHIFFEMQYPEYRLSELFKKEFSLLEESPIKKNKTNLD